MVGSAKESMTQATQAFSRQVGNTMSRTFGEKLSYDNLSSVGRQIGSSNSASSAVVNQVTDDLQTRYGFGDDKKDAVRGLVSGVLSGGLRVGGDGTITNTDDKEVADKQIEEIIARFPNFDSNSFSSGIVIGRLFNSFYYQYRRILKRSPTDSEFKEFIEFLKNKFD